MPARDRAMLSKMRERPVFLEAQPTALVRGRLRFQSPRAPDALSARRKRRSAELPLHDVMDRAAQALEPAPRNGFPSTDELSTGCDLTRMVEPDGIEPTTSCLQSTRSPS
jgi:hypothetical protein